MIETVTLHDGTTVKLGRKPPISDLAVPKLAYYMRTGGVPPPDTVDYTRRAQASISRMYLNDTYGDCVIASSYHCVGVWTGNESGAPVLGTDQEVLAAYHSICGPGDNGCVITEVLAAQKTKGLTFGGVTHKIDDFVAVDWTNKLEVQVALYLFGALKLGINLPGDWGSSKDIWDVTNSSIIGGHDVPVVGYDSQYATIATWGGLRRITWLAFQSRTWLEECYAILSPDWYSNANLAPCGVDVTRLRSDLEAIRNGTIPSIDPPGPTPTPTPTPPPGGWTGNDYI